MDQNDEEQEHEVYGSEIPDEGDMDDDIEMAARSEEYDEEQAPNSKDLEDMKKRLKEIEEEAGALREMQAKVEKEMGSVQDSSSGSASQAEKEEVDSRSIYVGNRFLLELEFVQCLANPTYIHYLAQNRYFEDEAFIGYLKYLQYWQRPEYIKFIMYPHCLYFLELLQNANFRNAMAHPGNKELAHRQQFFFWKNYRNNRLKHILPRPLPEPAPAAPAPVAPPPVQPVPPVLPSTMSLPTGSASAISPMPYGMPAGSALAKNDPRNAGIDRRKRKKDG